MEYVGKVAVLAVIESVRDDTTWCSGRMAACSKRRTHLVRAYGGTLGF